MNKPCGDITTFELGDIAEVLYYLNLVIESKDSLGLNPEASQNFKIGKKDILVEVLSNKPEKLEIENSSANIFSVSEELLAQINSGVCMFHMRLGSTDRYKTFFRFSTLQRTDVVQKNVRDKVRKST